MKVSRSHQSKILLMCLPLLCAHAYPGGQYPRGTSSFQTTSLASSSNSSATQQSSRKGNTLLTPPTRTSSSSQNPQEPITWTYTVTKTQEVTLTAPHATSTHLRARDHHLWDPDSPVLAPLDTAVQEDSSEEGGDCDGVEGEDEGNEDSDYDDDEGYDLTDDADDADGSGTDKEARRRHRRPLFSRSEGNACNEAFATIVSHLENIQTLLRESLSSQNNVLSSRQLGDVVDQEQSYGNRGKDLTQEQRASLEALVKGVNGYQGSLDGASNTGQLETEAEQQMTQTAESTPYFSNASPAQLAELIDLLRLIEERSRVSKPSSVTLGSQAGQSASQATWMVPDKSTLHEAAYSSGGSDAALMDAQMRVSSKMGSEDLLARLRDIRAREQDVLFQIQRQLAPSAKSRSSASGKETQTGLHRMTEEDLDDITSMVLADRAAKFGAKSGTQTSSTTSPSLVGTAAAATSPTDV